jgi:hypothetical protein
LKDFNNPFIGDHVPPEVEARLRGRLGIFREELAGKDRKKSPSFFSARRAPSRPIFRLAIGGAVIVGLIIAGTIIFPVRSGPQGLYAAVVNELSALRTIAYTVVISPGVEVELVSQSPGLERIRMSWGIDIISDENRGKTLVLFHKEKIYFWETAKGRENSLDNLNVFEDLPVKADMDLGERVIDGRSTVGFRVSKKISNQARLDIWIDPVTRRLAHVDINFMDKGVIVHHMEIKNVSINGPVEDLTFSLTPPPGYTEAAGEPAKNSLGIFSR